jgi:hypothetical protein
MHLPLETFMLRFLHVVHVAGALAAATLLCAADASPVSAAFGSTIVSTYPDGRTGELWLKPDGTYEARGRNGDGSSGHWKDDDGKLCLNQGKPLPFGSYCTPIPTAGLHGSWTAKAVTGEAIKVRLVKGHVIKPKAG